MKADIHPAYETIEVTCSCGNKFETRSNLCKPLGTDVCNECHPFYTGKQKTLDTGKPWPPRVRWHRRIADLDELHGRGIEGQTAAYPTGT